MENNSFGRNLEIMNLRKKLNKLKQQSSEVRFQQDTDGVEEDDNEVEG